jgi:hypothetical protein
VIIMTSQNVDRFLVDLEQALLEQQEPIAMLKLAAYASDAMRVLLILERHADMSKALDETLKSVCQDWRNPGAIEQPADLIATALTYAIAALQKALHRMEQATRSMHAPP